MGTYSQSIRSYCYVLIALLVGALFVLFAGFSRSATAAVGTNQELNFQGRLFNDQGAVVPDGFYNIQFTLYQDGDGQTVGNPSGTLLWTENHLNANGDGVQVKNGFLSVQLGSVTPFGSSVDWNQDTLWLSMNIGDTNGSCTPFSSCNPDGEMVPMKRLSSVPYAINSAQLGGLTTDQYVQIGQDAQTDSANGNSIQLNKTGTGDFITLQSNGSDAFVIGNSGDIAFGANADHIISVATAAADTAGNNLTVAAGDGGTGTTVNGGDLTLQGGAASGTGTSGSVIVQSNGSDSATAFQVQNSAGTALLNVDTTNGTLTIGTVGQPGGLALNDGNGQTTTVVAGDSAGNLTFILPTSAGNNAQCLKQGATANQLVFENCDGGAGGITATLQNAYDNSTGGTTPEVKLDSTRGAVDIQDADTPTGGTLFAVRASESEGGLGDTILSVDASGVYLGHSGAENGMLLFNNSTNSNTITIQSGVTSSSYSLTLPTALSGSGACLVDTDGSGTLGFSNCDGASAYIQGGNAFGATAVLGTTDSNSLEFITNDNTVVGLSGVTGAATFQNSSDSSSAFRVSNVAGNSVLTVNTTDGEILFGSPGNVDGTLVFSNSINSNTITLSPGTPSADQSVVFPNLSGTLCLSSGNCAGLGGNGDILQGGNNLGTDVIIGTNDTNNLQLETDGQTRLTVDTSGNIGVGGTSSGDRLSVASAISNTGAFETVLQDDFDATIDGSQWTSTGTTSADQTCDSESGNSLRFDGGTRQAETVDVDVSSGGAISFYVFSPSNDVTGCQSPEGGENLILEYSTNDGGAWTTLNTYTPDVDPMVAISESIPAGAQTSDTRFRWRQSSFNSDNDHWAIDTLTVVAITGEGNEELTDDFDPSIDGTQWSSTSNVSADTTCGGSGSVSGNALRFNGGGTRQTTSNGIDASAGGIISFYIYSPTGGGSGCEEPDGGENMVLEYSTNGGGNWTTISTYTPVVNPIALRTEFIPSGAHTTSTLFRWRQATHSGNNFDNWTIDNVSILLNTPPDGVGSTIYAYNNSADSTDLLRLASDVGGTESVKFRVSSNGDVYADGTFFGAGGVSAGAADLAEVYHNHDKAKPGHVVVFTDPYTVEKSSQINQRGLAGVVSTQPGFTLNADEKGVPVALSGRVPVKVTVAGGEIQKGDYLTSGPDGKAQKATSAGPVIGTALQDISEDGNIEVFVHLGHYDPVDEMLFQNNVLMSLHSSDVEVASLNVSGETKTSSLYVADNAYIGGELTVDTVKIASTLTIGGRIISEGQAVTPEALPALGYTGQVPSQSIEADGTDTAGTIKFMTGATPDGGELLRVKFSSQYETDPRVVLEPNNANGANLKTYVTKTKDGFIVHAISPPEASKTYSFDYIIIGSKVVVR